MKKYYRETNTLINKLLKEREEIKNKLEKSICFIVDCEKKDLSDIQLHQLHLLSMQVSIMELYIAILNERISNLTKGGYIV